MLEGCSSKIQIVQLGMKKEVIILWIISSLSVLHISAQETNAIEWQVDTCSVENQKVVKNEKLTDSEKRDFTYSKFYQMTFVGAPLIVTGMIVKGEDTHFRSLRNDYMQQFHRPFDDYTQFLPVAVMLGMKVAGVWRAGAPGAGCWLLMLSLRQSWEQWSIR